MVSDAECIGGQSYVTVIGAIKPAFPTPAAPHLTDFGGVFGSVVLGAATMLIVSFMEVYSIGTVRGDNLCHWQWHVGLLLAPRSSRLASTCSVSVLRAPCSAVRRASCSRRLCCVRMHGTESAW